MINAFKTFDKFAELLSRKFVLYGRILPILCKIALVTLFDHLLAPVKDLGQFK